MVFCVLDKKKSEEPIIVQPVITLFQDFNITLRSLLTPPAASHRDRDPRRRSSGFVRRQIGRRPDCSHSSRDLVTQLPFSSCRKNELNIVQLYLSFD